MGARAIWKGQLVVGKERIGVKLYSAVEDRAVHFRMLHTKDKAPVQQEIYRKDTGDVVEKEERRKAYPLEQGAVILQPEELESLEPTPSRDIELHQFVPPEALNDQWFDRPYYLGPDEDEAEYFAMVEALERQKVIGIARWVMRKQGYLGALTVTGGYLTMTTLRRADQVLSFSDIKPAKAAEPHANELKLAEQLVNSISGDFDPKQWHDEYIDRVRALVTAKARGKTIRAVKPKKRSEETDLAEGLRASLTALKGGKSG